MKPKPFISYTGGKQRYATEIVKQFPTVFHDYYEPFVGGGACFFELQKYIHPSCRKFSLSDLNKPLIQVIQTKPDKLIKELGKKKYVATREAFFDLRDKFNKIKFSEEYKIELAALYIYLNKCTFQGQYSENLKGQFNLGFNNKKNITICVTNDYNSPQQFYKMSNCTIVIINMF